ncbi:hypothetical protein ACFWNK_01725 [Streptomyces sp. NPDC058417]|uniref:hypothetical protein n=1 Tax=unclassified Streptomyces TaxID=2593676 RepID=UPI003669A04D
MPFPDGVQTVTLTGHQTLADGQGRPLPVRIRPVPARVVGAQWGVVVERDPVVIQPDDAGHWTVDLVATDAEGFDPTGWTYRVETGGDALYVSLPAALGEVDLSELVDAGADGGEYVLVPGPAGPPGPAGSTGPAGPQPLLGAAGTGPDVALRSDDPSTVNSRTPTVHAASHGTGGSDPISPAGIGAYPASDGNTLNGYVTDLQNRVGGGFGLEARATAVENRATALESGKLDKVGGSLTGSLTVNTPAAGDALVALHVGSETFDRVRLLTDRIEVGPGGAARDTNWRRSGANEWTTDDAVIVALMLRHLGSTLGFYGATAVAKPTVSGSRGGNAALGSLISALASLGLVTDGTTA